MTVRIRSNKYDFIVVDKYGVIDCCIFSRSPKDLQNTIENVPEMSNVSWPDIAELFRSETSRNRASHDEHVVRENKNADEERRREDVCMIFYGDSLESTSHYENGRPPLRPSANNKTPLWSWRNASESNEFRVSCMWNAKIYVWCVYVRVRARARGKRMHALARGTKLIEPVLFVVTLKTRVTKNHAPLAPICSFRTFFFLPAGCFPFVNLYALSRISKTWDYCSPSSSTSRIVFSSVKFSAHAFFLLFFLLLLILLHPFSFSRLLSDFLQRTVWRIYIYICLFISKFIKVWRILCAPIIENNRPKSKVYVFFKNIRQWSIAYSKNFIWIVWI